MRIRRLTAFSLVLASLLTLAACGGKEAAPPDAAPPEKKTDGDMILYDLGGVQAALPARYAEQLLVDTDFPDAEEGWKPLLSVYERASYEYSQSEYGAGGGFLFGLLSMDRASFEQSLSGGADGMDVFATDGERYYAYTYATDVQFCRPGGVNNTESAEWKEWEALNEIGPQVREDFLIRNGLEPVDVQAFLDQPFTYEGEHAYVKYCSWFVVDGDQQVYDTLILSQPVRQGEGGLWCVERRMDPQGNLYLYFPDSGKPAARHYADLQADCDAGKRPELLTPLGAAKLFAEESGYYRADGVVEGSFLLADEIPTAYMDANRRLQQMVQDIQWQNSPDAGDLLDTVGRLGPENWCFVEKYNAPGLDWWPSFRDALNRAAVGEDQRERDRNMIACAFSLPESWGERYADLTSLLRRQRDADPDAFAAALAEFPENVRLSLTFQFSFGSNETNSDLPEPAERPD